MKYINALTFLLLTVFTDTSFAHEMTNDCAAKAAKIANVAQRDAAIKDCLAKVASPGSVAQHEQHDKEQHCDANAKSMKLDGKDKADYLEHCYNENDFNKNQKPHPKVAK